MTLSASQRAAVEAMLTLVEQDYHNARELANLLRAVDPPNTTAQRAGAWDAAETFMHVSAAREALARDDHAGVLKELEAAERARDHLVTLASAMYRRVVGLKVEDVASR